jgi:hypothetical protein
MCLHSTTSWLGVMPRGTSVIPVGDGVAEMPVGAPVCDGVPVDEPVGDGVLEGASGHWAALRNARLGFKTSLKEHFHWSQYLL